MFTELQGLLDHKKEYCKLRFACKCNYNPAKSNNNNNNNNNSECRTYNLNDFAKNKPFYYECSNIRRYTTALTYFRR